MTSLKKSRSTKASRPTPEIEIPATSHGLEINYKFSLTVLDRPCMANRDEEGSTKIRCDGIVVWYNTIEHCAAATDPEQKRALHFIGDLSSKFCENCWRKLLPAKVSLAAPVPT